VCLCNGRSKHTDFATFDLSLWAYIEETVYAKWVNFQGLWNCLTAGTLPIAHVCLTGEWIELEHGCKPGACGLHAARQLVLCGPQLRESKLHTYSKKFHFSYPKKYIILNCISSLMQFGFLNCAVIHPLYVTDGTLSNPGVISFKLRGLS
jgi:hypothetical protein